MFNDKDTLNKFLKSRGITDPDRQLNMKKEDIPSVLLLNDAQKLIDSLVDELKNGNRITVVGDYDADGICGTTIALRALRIAANGLGVKPFVNYIVPHRFEDGYGLSKGLIDKTILQNPKTSVILTVDNGTVANEAVNYAKMKGLRVYITDHHQGDLPAPNADALVNPNAVGDPYPFKGISGATVVYKLFREMAIQYFPDKLEEMESLIDFAGVSTVADMMPILEENRYYVRESLNIFNGESEHRLRFAWLAMIEYLVRIKKTNKDQFFTEKDYGFTFGPILNAQSRVEGAADIAIDLFESKDTTDIREKVEYMVSINEKRKALSNESFDNIDKDAYSGKSAIVIRDDSLGEGFIGLVAGKISQYFNRPAVVFTKSKLGLKGSARSIEGVNLLQLLRSIDSNIYINVGGHSAAAGMTIYEDKFDEFSHQLESKANEIIDPDYESEVKYDFVKNSISFEDVESIDSLAPYGIGFEKPVILLKDIKIDNHYRMGSDKQHLKISTEDLDVVCWNASDELMDAAETAKYVTVIGEPSINDYLGSISLQVIADEKEIKLK